MVARSRNLRNGRTIEFCKNSSAVWLLLLLRLSPDKSEDLQLLVAGYEYLAVSNHWNGIRVATQVWPVSGSDSNQLLDGVLFLAGVRIVGNEMERRFPSAQRTRQSPDDGIGCSVR